MYVPLQQVAIYPQFPDDMNTDGPRNLRLLAFQPRDVAANSEEVPFRYIQKLQTVSLRNF